MIEIIYFVGCILSFVLTCLWYKKCRVYFTKDERTLTLCLWFPFMTVASWCGVMLMCYCQIANIDDFNNE